MRVRGRERIGAAVVAVVATLSGHALAQREPGMAFVSAIERGDLAEVKGLLDGGAAADTPINYGDNAMTPLMKAAMEGRTDIARLLIERGAKVNASSDPFGTPLHQATSGAWTDTMKVLIAAGADVNARDERQNTALTTAVFQGKRDVVEVLVDAHTDLEASLHGNSPLMLAAGAGDVDMVRLLARSGAKVNALSKGEYGGRTALLSAVESGQLEAVQALIELKADVNLRDGKGQTPLAAAREAHHDDIVAALKAAGAREPGATVKPRRKTP